MIKIDECTEYRQTPRIRHIYWARGGCEMLFALLAKSEMRHDRTVSIWRFDHFGAAHDDMSGAIGVKTYRINWTACRITSRSFDVVVGKLDSRLADLDELSLRPVAAQPDDGNIGEILCIGGCGELPRHRIRKPW